MACQSGAAPAHEIDGKMAFYFEAKQKFISLAQFMSPSKDLASEYPSRRAGIIFISTPRKSEAATRQELSLKQKAISNNHNDHSGRRVEL